MIPPTLRELLFPQDERDPDFRRELQRLALSGVRTASAVGIGGPILLVLMGSLGVPGILDVFTLERSVLSILLAGAPLALSFFPRSHPHMRALGIATGLLVALEAIVFVPRILADPLQAAQVSATKVAMVMLVAVAAFPLRPVQMLFLGLGITLPHAAMSASSAYPVDQPGALVPLVSVFMTALICTVLTTILYRQRAFAFRARKAAERSLDELVKAQARLIVSENAHSLGRFAAALSHELNSPLGALGSAAETLVSLVEQGPRRAPPERVAEVAKGATETARRSLQRLRETVERMKHFTNLDRAEVQVVNLNRLWEDTVALLAAEIEGRAGVTLELAPLPPVKCRPQQLSAVFSNLLRNAAAAVDAGGSIRIRSAHRGADVVLEVHDDGRGIPAEQLSRLFDPAFRVQSSRVGTGWGLFVSRSIISDHGGQLEIASALGRGTTATITLPVPVPLAGVA
jgi:signal transduction histidine kinase